MHRQRNGVDNLVGYGYLTRYRGIEPLRRAVAQSFATAMITLSSSEGGPPYKPYHDVIFYNAKTRQPVAVPALSDQGNDVTLLTEDWREKLGYSDEMCTPLGVTGVGGSMAKEFCAVEGIIQIHPNLKPVTTTFAFGPTPKNLLGRQSILGRYNVTYTPTTVHYSETSGFFENKDEAMAAYARNSEIYTSPRRYQAGFRSRI